MSAFASYRERVMHAIKSGVTSLKHVDWNDGLFDEREIREWSVASPSAFVSIHNIITSHHSTGELNAETRIRVVVVAHNKRKPRDADIACWLAIEQIAVIANQNKFSQKPEGGQDHSAGPATDLRLERIPDPQLLDEGVALGLVEWSANICFGINRVREREFIHTPVPTTVFADTTAIRGDDTTSETFQVVYPEDLTP